MYQTHLHGIFINHQLQCPPQFSCISTSTCAHRFFRRHRWAVFPNFREVSTKRCFCRGRDLLHGVGIGTSGFCCWPFHVFFVNEIPWYDPKEAMNKIDFISAHVRPVGSSGYQIPQALVGECGIWVPTWSDWTRCQDPTNDRSLILRTSANFQLMPTKHCHSQK